MEKQKKQEISEHKVFYICYNNRFQKNLKRPHVILSLASSNVTIAMFSSRHANKHTESSY